MVWVDCPAVYAIMKFTSLSGKLDHNHLAPNSGTRLLRNVTMWLAEYLRMQHMCNVMSELLSALFKTSVCYKQLL